MSGGTSVEDTLTLWASSLRDVKRRIRPLFTQERVARSAGQFLDGLLGNEPRKTGWMRAEAAGDPGPWRQQAILGRRPWDADALRDVVREYALETLSDGDAVLVIDETGFLKQGKASCGVARPVASRSSSLNGVSRSTVFSHGRSGGELTKPTPAALTSDKTTTVMLITLAPHPPSPRKRGEGVPLGASPCRCCTFTRIPLQGRG